jgi:hypothetical protein
MEVMRIHENADPYTAENNERDDCHQADEHNIYDVHGGAAWLYSGWAGWFNNGSRGLD